MISTVSNHPPRMKHEPTGEQLNTLAAIYQNAVGTIQWVTHKVIRHWESIRPSDQQTGVKLADQQVMINDLSSKLKEAQAELKAAKEALPEWIPVTPGLAVDGCVVAITTDGVIWNTHEPASRGGKHFSHYIRHETLANLPKREPVKADPVEQERKEFEQWADPLGYALNWSAGNYVSPRTDNAWQGWKAAREGGAK
jgi:hypothetical protein